MREVIYLPPDAKSPPLRALTCFEDPKYIHNTAFLPSSQPAAAYNSAVADAEGGHPTDSSTLRFELVRHRLAFDVRGGVLESIQHRGWHVRCSDRDADMARGAAAMPPGLCDFLVLHPDSPVATLLVLIPDGTIETSGDRSEVNIEQSDAPEAQCGHHVYSVHPRTGMLSCATIEARLFLAALYAACGCAVAVPGTGRTGGEMALELVRQSAVNRPLSVAEARNLETVAQFAGHTPALRIAVAHLAEQAAAVAFLHTDADAAGEPPAAFAARMAVNPEEGAVYEQAQRAAPPPFGNCRAALTRTERRLQFACASAFQHGAHAVRLHGKNDWQGVGDDLTHSAVCALQQRSRKMGERLTPKPQERRRARVATSVTLPFGIPSDYGALGEELASGLLQSLAACAEDGADLASAAGAEPDASTLASVAADLHALADDVQLAERKLREALLQALALTPAGRAKHNLEALRSAGLVAVPAVSDLVLAAVEVGLIQACISPGHDDHLLRPASLDVPPLCMLRNTHIAGCCKLLSRLLASLLPSTTCMQALNPYLSDSAVSAVIEAAQDWQELCVLHDKLQRNALCLPGAAVGTADGEADRTLTRLAADLRNTCAQRLDRKRRPAWLAFQVRVCLWRAYRLHRMPLACLKLALSHSVMCQGVALSRHWRVPRLHVCTRRFARNEPRNWPWSCIQIQISSEDFHLIILIVMDHICLLAPAGAAPP